MTPVWQSWDAFWAMGGYARYVWGSFGMCALVFAAELWALRARRRSLAADGAPAIGSDDR
jgi:heme exporter protein D